MKRSCLIGALACAAALVPAGSAFGATEVVTESDVNNPASGWYSADTRPDGTWAFESGPGTPPLGAGSVQLSTPSSAAKVQLLTDAYDGVALADIDGLGYSTYQDPTTTSAVAVVALNLRVDFTGDGQPDAYVVYEPYQDETNEEAVQEGVWQTWDAYKGGDAEWWINTGGGIGCGQATPCSWSSIVAAYPNATIEEGAIPGSFGLNQGSGNAGTLSNADALTISVNGEETVYDFEPTLAPATKDDCKDGGWATFNSPAFRNQGECVSSFAPGRTK